MRPVLGIFSVFPELKHVWKGCFGQGTIKNAGTVTRLSNPATHAL